MIVTINMDWMSKQRLCLSITALLILAVAPVWGQIEGLQRYWDEGPLEWSDFLTTRRTVTNLSSTAWSDIDVVWTLRSETIDQGNYSFEHLFSLCSMNRYTSWVYEDARSEAHLRYEQVIFDLYELHRRYFQMAYENSPAKDNVDELWDIHFQRAKSAVAQFKQASDYGRDTAVIAQYEQMLDGYLAYGEPEPTPPQYELGKIGWGGHIGYFGEFFLHDENGYLPASVHGLGFGVEVDHNRLSVLADFSMLFAGRQPEAIKYKSYTWEANDWVNAVNMELAAAYSLWEGRWLRLSPMAGVGAGIIENGTFNSRYDLDYEDIPYQMGGFRLLAGVMLDWKYRIRLGFYDYNRVYTERALRLRCYVARTKLPTVEKISDTNPLTESGYSINVALSWHFIARELK